MSWWSKQKLANKIFIFVIIGVIVGLIAGPKAELLKPIGDIFIRMVQMMVILLIVPALINGMAVLDDPKKIGKVGIRIVIVFLLTTIFAGVLALVMANLIGPGRGLNMALPKGYEYTKPTQTIVDVLVNIVPKNPIAAFANGDLLAILFVVLFFGVVLAGIVKTNSVLKRFFAEWTEVSMGMLDKIMKLAPFGAGALIAYSVGVHGPKVLGPLALFVGMLYIGEILILVEYIVIMLVNGISPMKFFKAVSEPAMVSFSTCSSMASLASNVKATEKMGVPNGVATFGITLGNVINMDGTALYQAMAVVFISQVYGIQLTITSQIMVVVMASLVTISMVGVPGAGTATLGILLLSVGLPVEGIGLILAVDRICDMPRTMNNNIGDSMTTVICAKSVGLLDPESPILLKPSTKSTGTTV